MDNTSAIQSLPVHVEAQWQELAAVEPYAFLALVGDRWLWIKLRVESDDPQSYETTLRGMTQSFKSGAVAFAARETGGDQHFYATVEFRDNSCRRSLVWQIVGDALVNFRVMDHAPRDDEDDDMRVFTPASAGREAPPVEPSEFIKVEPRQEDTDWGLLRKPVIRIIVDHQRHGSGGK